MKSFKDFQNISELNKTSNANNAPSESDMNLNDITSDEIVSSINRFVAPLVVWNILTQWQV